MVGMMCQPPKQGDPSFPLYSQQWTAIHGLKSLLGFPFYSMVFLVEFSFTVLLSFLFYGNSALVST